MSKKITIFISYSHDDVYHQKELLKFLKGLENDGIEFWSDQQIATGELWDETIKIKIADSLIVLALVSQAFLDSSYCTKDEIGRFLAQQTYIFPVILSACEWQRHDWLKCRQFLPSNNKTIEEDYKDLGSRKRLFLEIRQQLRELIAKLSQPSSTVNPFSQTLAIRDPSYFIGRQAELRRIQMMLQGGSVALLGAPKIGKSSLLWQLAQSWQGEILGPLDFQELEDRDDFYSSLSSQLSLLNSDWRDVRDALRTRQALLLLDELDSGPERGLDSSDLARFRAICGNNPSFKIMAVSRYPLKEIFPDSNKGSPAYNFLQPLTLGGMSENESRQLLQHPWMPAAQAFDEQTTNEILNLAKFHPFKLQRVAFHRYQTLIDSTHDWQVAWRQDIEHML